MTNFWGKYQARMEVRRARRRYVRAVREWARYGTTVANECERLEAARMLRNALVWRDSVCGGGK